MSKKVKKTGWLAARDFVAMCEYIAGAPTPTPSKKGKLDKIARKNKARDRRNDPDASS